MEKPTTRRKHALPKFSQTFQNVSYILILLFQKWKAVLKYRFCEMLYGMHETTAHFAILLKMGLILPNIAIMLRVRIISTF